MGMLGQDDLSMENTSYQKVRFGWVGNGKTRYFWV